MRLNVSQFEQYEPFVATHPLPTLPHKNSRLDDALRVAKALGCEMKSVNDNDVAIAHPLVNLEAAGAGRPGLSVSRGRKSTSQALVSFLRKVSKATLSHPIYIKSRKEFEMNNGTTVLKGGIDGVAQHKPKLPEPEMKLPEPPNANHVGRPEPPKPKEDFPQPFSRHDNWAIRSGGDMFRAKDGLMKIVGSVFASIHYNDVAMTRKPGDAILTFSDAETALREQFDRARGLIDVLFQQTCAQARHIEKLEEELTRPAPKPEAPPVAEKVNAIPPGEKAEWAKPKEAVPKNPSPSGGNKALLDEMVSRLRFEGSRRLEGFPAGRVCDAIIMVAKELNYSDEMVEDFRKLDVEKYAYRVKKMKRPGGKRKMVGDVGWDTFIGMLGQIEKQWRQSYGSA